MDPKLDAFSKLVAEHQANVRTYVRMIGVESAWVDDVAQEAFLVAYHKFNQFDPSSGSFAAWVRGIARHLAANQRRATGRRTRLHASAALAASLSSPAADDEVPSSLDEARLALAQCLQQLPEHGQQLLRLRYSEDLGAEDIGRQLGREGNAVRQALFRWRDALRRCIDARLGSQEWA
jgi:RNA polymerase sigma-70 factor (ECF subfamily)